MKPPTEELMSPSNSLLEEIQCEENPKVHELIKTSSDTDDNLDEDMECSSDDETEYPPPPPSMLDSLVFIPKPLNLTKLAERFANFEKRYMSSFNSKPPEEQKEPENRADEDNIEARLKSLAKQVTWKDEYRTTTREKLHKSREAHQPPCETLQPACEVLQPAHGKLQPAREKLETSFMMQPPAQSTGLEMLNRALAKVETGSMAQPKTQSGLEMLQRALEMAQPVSRFSTPASVTPQLPSKVSKPASVMPQPLFEMQQPLFEIPMPVSETPQPSFVTPPPVFEIPKHVQGVPAAEYFLPQLAPSNNYWLTPRPWTFHPYGPNPYVPVPNAHHYLPNGGAMVSPSGTRRPMAENNSYNHFFRR